MFTNNSPYNYFKFDFGYRLFIFLVEFTDDAAPLSDVHNSDVKSCTEDSKFWYQCDNEKLSRRLSSSDRMNSSPPTARHRYHSLVSFKLTRGSRNGCGETISSSNFLRVLFLIHSAIFFSVVSGCVDLQPSIIHFNEVFVVRAAASDNAALSVVLFSII